jgi:hypothetical protein
MRSRRRIAFAFLMWALLPSAALPANEQPLPKFEDYPALEKLVGAPKEPVLRTAAQKSYATRLRRGVLEGEGLLGVDRPDSSPRPNFAGSFYAIMWSCGSDGCASLALVDGRTGTVYGPPPNGNPARTGFVASPRTHGCKGIDLRPDSRLLFVDYVDWSLGRPVCHRSYYEWRDQRYWLISERVMPSR